MLDIQPKQDRTCSRAKLPVGSRSAAPLLLRLNHVVQIEEGGKTDVLSVSNGLLLHIRLFCAFYSYWTKAIVAAITLQQFHLDSHSSLQAVSLCHTSSANGPKRTSELPHYY